MNENEYIPNFLVSIQCMTYNHAPYIEDAMDGFCIQQTDFPYIAIICDDASTDGESDVIRKYLDRYFAVSSSPEYQTWTDEEANYIFARHQHNIQCYFLVVLLKSNYYSQKKDKSHLWEKWESTANYIAICEGDDYWIDPLKLQKQVNFLQHNPDFGMCYTKAKILMNGVFVGESGTSDTSFMGLLYYSNFPTQTRVYRKSIWLDYINEINPDMKGWMMGDYPFAFYVTIKSKILFIDECSSVYRFIEESASHSNNINYLFKFYDSADDVRLYFIYYYIKDMRQRNYLVRCIKKQNLLYKLPKLLASKRIKEARDLYLQHSNVLSSYDKLKFGISTLSFTFYRMICILESYIYIFKKMIREYKERAFFDKFAGQEV